MKNPLLIVLLLAAVVSASAQDYEVSGLKKPGTTTSTPSKPTGSVSPPGLRMRNVGRTLAICSAVPLISGIALMSSADALYYNSTTGPNGTYNEGDPKGALGVMLFVTGVGMGVTGGILWSKGQKKYNRFMRDQSVSFRTGFNQVSLTYRF